MPPDRRKRWRHPTDRGHHPLYRCWNNMRNRCTDPTHKSWKDYGGRGIKIYAAWLDDYDAFCDYVGPHPGRGLTLDRIDNAGDYEPGNLRWATHAKQIQNSRHAKLTDTTVVNMRKRYARGDIGFAELAKLFGVNTSTAHRVIRKIYWKGVTP